MLIVCPLLLELASALQFDVQDEFDGNEELLPGFSTALRHVGPKGLVEVFDETLESDLK